MKAITEEERGSSRTLCLYPDVFFCSLIEGIMCPSVLLKVADDCEAGDFLQASANPMGCSWSIQWNMTCIKYASRSTQQGAASRCVARPLSNMSAQHHEKDTG